MQPYLPIITFVLGLLVAGTVGTLVALARERDFKHTVAAYARIIETDDKRFDSVIDRLYVSKNHAPSQVDLKSEHEARRERAQARSQERQDIPRRVGPVDSGTLEMELQVRRARGGS